MPQSTRVYLSTRFAISCSDSHQVHFQICRRVMPRIARTFFLCGKECGSSVVIRSSHYSSANKARPESARLDYTPSTSSQHGDFWDIELLRTMSNEHSRTTTPMLSALYSWSIGRLGWEQSCVLLKRQTTTFLGNSCKSKVWKHIYAWRGIDKEVHIPRGVFPERTEDIRLLSFLVWRLPSALSDRDVTFTVQDN